MKLRFARPNYVHDSINWWVRYTNNLYPVWNNDPMKYLRKALR